jgi:hypothetical protein
MKGCELARSLLSPQEKKLLLETQDILEELLETEQVLEDETLMKSIRTSQRDLQVGKVYTIERLKKQLRKEGKL